MREKEFNKYEDDINEAVYHVVYFRETWDQARANGDGHHVNTKASGVNADDYNIYETLWKDDSMDRIASVIYPQKGFN